MVEKNYKRLAIQVSMSGFSYCIFDTFYNRIDLVKEVDFSALPKTSKVEDYYWKAFLDNRELTKMYDDVVVLHDNNFNSFVPLPLFDENFLGSYLQYNTKVFETDSFAFDVIPNYDINNVYVPYANINNYLLDQFDGFDYKHVSSILVTKLLDVSKNVEEKQVFVHFGHQRLDIVVVKNQQLLFFNTFEYRTKEDFIYYLLFTAEQLGLNPEHFSLQLLGNISRESPFFEMAYLYVRNVSIADLSVFQKANSFSEAQNLKHFILFQS
ncbi:MAG TPA: DUF3822 family protein [Flavobacterium sp.]